MVDVCCSLSCPTLTYALLESPKDAVLANFRVALEGDASAQVTGHFVLPGRCIRVGLVWFAFFSVLAYAACSAQVQLATPGAGALA